jgi:hypothetical protein
MADKAQRTEADDEWLTSHRSNIMGWLRRRFRVFGVIGGAVSYSETGPYTGVPRNPRLRADDGSKAYSTVRYTTDQIAYTTTSTNADQCPRCGQPLADRHVLENVHGEDTRTQVGAVRTCPDCRTNSWLLHSRMPTVTQARDTARRNVL